MSWASLEESVTRIQPSLNVRELRVGVGLAEYPAQSREGDELLRLAEARARGDYAAQVEESSSAVK